MDNDLLNIENAYKQLIESEVFLGRDLNEKINNALNGYPLPTETDWKEYFNVKVNKMNYDELEYYYTLTSEQKEENNLKIFESQFMSFIKVISSFTKNIKPK